MTVALELLQQKPTSQFKCDWPMATLRERISAEAEAIGHALRSHKRGS
ncbi:hypothetical protein [Moorena sp. SIO3I6]|nr:hypothetical protein [Moorena sp. SIO3I6]NEP28358.1 hypothetical protein [Moorena sp. SIO3I6]